MTRAPYKIGHDELLRLLVEIRSLALSPHNRMGEATTPEAYMLVTLGQIAGLADATIQMIRKQQ